ncbi:hypothetical protein [Photorhabdus bodei]|uniref:Uncharacterized protein n=1 Tax=Photorhabdus bodei TaxID=2029681 RepID=A0ABX0ASC7_9GAMM|nr:hypothetical protein [Photorhabdus bodei]NDL05823.1 hypothetical protein [Photorhabdus bodei]
MAASLGNRYALTQVTPSSFRDVYCTLVKTWIKIVQSEIVIANVAEGTAQRV